MIQHIETSLTVLCQRDVPQNSLPYKVVWCTHFSGILSVKGPTSNRSRYAHLWRAACVRVSSISCHTVAATIILLAVMRTVNALRCNKACSVSHSALAQAAVLPSAVSLLFTAVYSTWSQYSLPDYLLTYLLTYLPTYLIPTYLLTYLFTYLPTYIVTYLFNYLLTYLITYLITDLPTYLISYLLT
jgi:hypothetical protein